MALTLEVKKARKREFDATGQVNELPTCTSSNSNQLY